MVSKLETAILPADKTVPKLLKGQVSQKPPLLHFWFLGPSLWKPSLCLRSLPADQITKLLSAGSRHCRHVRMLVLTQNHLVATITTGFLAITAIKVS